MNYEKISGFTDEIGSSLHAQIEGAKKAGMSYVCLRNVNGKNIAEYTLPEAQEQIIEPLLRAGIGVSSIGSPFGKIAADDEEGFARQMAQAKNMAEIAKALECRYIRMFSFYIPDGAAPEQWRTVIVEKLKQFVGLFAEYGITVLHENEKEIYGDTAKRCRELFEAVDSKYFRGIFDFANYVQCGEDVWQAYETVKEFTEYFHIKDALASNQETVLCGTGDGQIEKIVRDAFAHGYQGFLTLEPHLVQFDGLAALERRDVNEIVKEKKALSGLDAFLMQHKALEQILESVTGV